MEWQQFLWVSDKLNPGRQYSDTDYHELALTRSGISRAYYAAHNVARLYVKNKLGLWLRHEELWQELQDQSNPDESAAGDLGQELRADRNQADYDAWLTANDLIQKHIQALNNGHEICRLLGQPFPRRQKKQAAKAPPKK